MLPYFSHFYPYKNIACENLRFSSLFADGDISRGGTSATQWQNELSVSGG